MSERINLPEDADIFRRAVDRLARWDDARNTKTPLNNGFVQITNSHLLKALQNMCGDYIAESRP